MVILIVNILIIFYRDEWFGYILSLCTENVIMKLICSKKYYILVNYVLGIMFNYFVFKWNGFMILIWLVRGV